MFEDETVGVACPKCGHNNPIPVRELEKSAELHFTCEDCGVSVRVEADEFRQRLERVRQEVEELERGAAQEAKRKIKRPRKGDFQI